MRTLAQGRLAGGSQNRDGKERVESRRRLVGEEQILFFQAEDGIRDIGVTGVQTCALPIFMQELREDPKAERLENVGELLNSIKYYEQVNENEDISLTTYLQDIALYTNADYKKDEKTIKLMTIHQAKGLEFPYVFVCGLTEGIFPSHRTIRERRKTGEEEERKIG